MTHVSSEQSRGEPPRSPDASLEDAAIDAVLNGTDAADWDSAEAELVSDLQWLVVPEAGGGLSEGLRADLLEAAPRPEGLHRSGEGPPGGGVSPAFAWVGWMAACLLLAGWLVVWPAGGADAEGVTAFRQYAALQGRPETVAVSWAAGPTAGDQPATGEVVWSPPEQAGVMRLVDLPVNDPTVEQYQLWIFDAERDERYPVDGGVFDVRQAGESFVPFRPRVPVSEVTLFAVTVEQPGGVVVSDRSRLPVLASVSESS